MLGLFCLATIVLADVALILLGKSFARGQVAMMEVDRERRDVK